VDKVIQTVDNQLHIVNTWAQIVDNYLFSVDKPVESGTYRLVLLR